MAIAPAPDVATPKIPREACALTPRIQPCPRPPEHCPDCTTHTPPRVHPTERRTPNAVHCSVPRVPSWYDAYVPSSPGIVRSWVRLLNETTGWECARAYCPADLPAPGCKGILGR